MKFYRLPRDFCHFLGSVSSQEMVVKFSSWTSEFSFDQSPTIVSFFLTFFRFFIPHFLIRWLWLTYWLLQPPLTVTCPGCWLGPRHFPKRGPHGKVGEPWRTQWAGRTQGAVATCGWEYHLNYPQFHQFSTIVPRMVSIYIHIIHTYYLYTVEMKPIPVMVYCCGSHIWVCQTNVGEPVIYVNWTWFFALIDGNFGVYPISGQTHMLWWPNTWRFFKTKSNKHVIKSRAMRMKNGIII